jgi:peptide/nickel transport system permease protein
MGLYLLRRTGQALLVMVGLSLAVFLLIQLVPGDPARAILGPRATASAVAALRMRLGLDAPLPLQYWRFLWRAVRLNFGVSTSQDVAVSQLLWPRLGATLMLTAYATIVSIIIAGPLAIVSAVRKNRLPDHIIRLTTMVTFAMPAFWLGLVLILLLAVKVTVFPPSGYGTGLFGHLDSLTLPALTLGLGIAPLVLRTLRGSLIDTLASEFVEAAQARGLGQRRVMLRYALRNSLVASITVIGVNVGYILGIVVVVENVFALPGLGSLLVTAVQDRDFPVVQGVALVLGAIIVIVNLFTDLGYSLLDPRVRLNARG